MPHRTRVLVVDDNPDTVQSMRLLLETEGYNAKGIYSARTIMSDFREFEPDVVIMDISMPGKTGWDAARQLRAAVKDRRLMLIAISGEFTKGADNVLAEMSGFDYFLMKPCDPNVVLKLVASFTPKA